MANPFVAGPISESTNLAPAETFREFAWDFEKDDFILDDNGSYTIVEGNEAMKVWVYKCLMTERYRYRAYFDDYGAELEQFIGKPNDGTEGTELFRYVKEALMVNPHISSVNDVYMELRGKKVILNVALDTEYGSQSVEVEV